jgi:serine protease Do
LLEVAASEPGRVFLVASRALKAVAILGGGALTIVALMSVAGLVIGNGWIRLAIAAVVAIGLPLIAADRLLPADADRGKGIVTDVLAVSWLAFALLFAGVGIGLTRPLLERQADRFAAAELGRLARATHWVAGSGRAAAVEPAPEPAPVAGGPADAAPPVEPLAVPPDAAVAAVAPPAAGADAGASAEDPDPERPPEMKPEEIFKAWAPSVVTVQVQGALPGIQGGGTGFVIDDDGTVVTNHHVIEHARDVKVKLMDGSWAETVELLAFDADQDVALLRIAPARGLKSAVLGDSEAVTVGERAIAIGNPLGLEHTLTDGLISARRVIEGRRLIQTSTPVSPGNSGGPLFNSRGEVIGVTTAIYGAGISQNLNLAVPINTVKDYIKAEYPDRKRIGGGGGPDLGTW